MVYLKLLMSVLAIVLLFIPGVMAMEGENPGVMPLEGENPVETVNRLTNEVVLLIAAVSFFCIVLGVLILILGGASPGLRAWGSRLIVGVLVGNLVILAVPWFLDIIKP